MNVTDAEYTKLKKDEARLDWLANTNQFIGNDLDYRWITEFNNLKAHEVINMMRIETKKSLSTTIQEEGD